MNIIGAIDDPALFGPWFKGPAWRAWRAALRAIFGLLDMSKSELVTYRRCTGRRGVPKAQCSEVYLICGRRSGKSFILAVIAVFLACFKDWRPHLGPGERGTIMVIASDRKQARVILRYIAGLLEVPMLAARVEGQTAESFDLVNRVTIEVHTANFRSVRGYSIIAALCDELSFWRADDFSASPDREVIDAIRPAMATIPGAMLLCASSPYARRGVLWEAYRRHYGKDGPVLVWQAPTWVMNPRVPQRVIDEAMERDEAVARSEYGAEFRKDLADFVNRQVVEALLDRGVRERAPAAGQRNVAFCDPSGGSGGDSFTLAVAHREGDVVVLDAMRERRPPFQPSAVVEEFSSLLRSYGVAEVEGDRYAGSWPGEAFGKHNITYRPAQLDKSSIYIDCLPLMNSARVRLIDNDRLVAQLCGLERRTRVGGADRIDHPVHGRDDVANAACGALLRARAGRVLEGDVRELASFGKQLAAAHAESIFDLGPGDMAPWDRPGGGSPWN